MTGIDVGNHGVKLVRLEGEDAAGLTLTHWGAEPLGDEKSGRAAAALHRLFKRLGLRVRALGRVATALGGPEVHVRQALMPRLSSEDLRRALPYEARKHLPLENLKNPCLDFQILGEASGNGSGVLDRQRVLLVAAPRGGRDRLLEVLGKAGVHPEVIDAQPLPLVNAVTEAHPSRDGESADLIVDLGASAGVLAAVLPGGNLYSRALRFTGSSVTQSVEQDLETDRGRAEQAKRELAGPDWSQSAPSLEAEVQGLVRELEETLRFLRVKERAAKVSTLYLTGGASLLPGLDERLQQALGVDVQRPDPFRIVDAGKNGRPDTMEAAGLVGAMGLARWWN